MVLHLVGAAHGILGQGAGVLIDADRVQLLALGGEDLGGRGAADVEEGGKGLGNLLDVLLVHAERLGGEADLLDEVGYLGVVEVHELVNLEHGRVGLVGVEPGHALHGAAQKGAEELVEMGEEEARGRVVSQGRFVLGR